VCRVGVGERGWGREEVGGGWGGLKPQVSPENLILGENQLGISKPKRPFCGKSLHSPPGGGISFGIDKGDDSLLSLRSYFT